MRVVETFKEHPHFMRIAIGLARRDADAPFGAVVADSKTGEIFGTGWGTGTEHDCTAHSEMKAIQAAQARRPGELTGLTVFSTHEPCTMCAGALVHARPDAVVFGTYRADLPWRFRQRAVSAEAILADCSRPALVIGGILWRECIQLFPLQDVLAGAE